ncbi:MAG TPA: hypothetical protein VG269_07255 [Tepidisphaeraceae bacterium]|nr:hypothetical protein [Tepidisphaeraceae bacterium]
MTFPVGLERDLAARLLPLLAALQPLRPEDPDVGAAVATFVGANVTEVLRTIGKFEESGVLFRRGGVVRIVPDVLADHLLQRACVTNSGAITGYADQVFRAFRDDIGGAVLRNLSELDWRVRAAARIVATAAVPDSGPTVLRRVWHDVRERFAAAPNSDRVNILRRLHEVAYLQPGEVLEIAELAMRTPATAAERGIASPFVEWTQNGVLHRLPALLRQVAYHETHLQACCDMLWALGRDDERDVNADHPIRILQDIAGYDVGKLLEYAEIVMSAIERWTDAPDAYLHRHTPLDALDPLMEKGSASWRSNRRGFSFTPFLIDPDMVAAVQRRGFALLAAAVDSPASRSPSGLSTRSAACSRPHRLRVSRCPMPRWSSAGSPSACRHSTCSAAP